MAMSNSHGSTQLSRLPIGGTVPYESPADVIKYFAELEFSAPVPSNFYSLCGEMRALGLIPSNYTLMTPSELFPMLKEGAVSFQDVQARRRLATQRALTESPELFVQNPKDTRWLITQEAAKILAEVKAEAKPKERAKKKPKGKVESRVIRRLLGG